MTLQAGAVVFRREGERITFAMVLDTYGFWALPKGSLEENESLEDAAKREVQEELGIKNLQLILELGRLEYPVQTKKGAQNRVVHYFLIETHDSQITLEKSSGIVDAKWLDQVDIRHLRRRADIGNIMERAFQALSL